jgi:DNA-binding HxlR family transcriptional regulator
MTSTIDSLHKILKDETRRKIILELNEKGSVGYTDLMESLGIISTGTLNYHLKVLGDLLQKDRAEKYELSEKGKLAYRVLTEFPNLQPQVTDRRVLKMMLFFGVTSVILAIVIGFVWNVPLERTALVVIVTVLSFGFAFYIRVKPTRTGNRVFFIAIGTFCLGFVFWALITLLILHSGLRWQIQSATGPFGDDFVAATTLIICWILGGWVGDLIGKRRNYIIPMLRV